jgi:serine/threonine protein kinase
MSGAPPSLSDPYRRLSTGRVLGDKFEILGVLGEGGTGVVYDALRLQEKDNVALKVIHPHLLGDKQIRGRFTREAAILRRLTGPHLCAILDFGELSDPRGEEAGLVYIALPKIEGTPLDRLIKEQPSIERSLDIVLQVCEALKSAHAQGVIHRDLKPANVILRDGKHVMVVDFGLAKIVTGGGTGTTALTAHNMVFGTPEYMAPEQARGDELDARCDVYATGIILYELLTGTVPFTGATPLNVLTAQLTAQPVPPRVKAPERGITAAVEAVVMHAIAKDPAERYATAGAFAAAIVHARARPEDPQSVRPTTFHIDRDDLPDGHAATIPAPLPTDPKLVSSPPASRLTPTVPPAPDSKRGLSSRNWTVLWVVAALASIGLGVWLSLRSN